MTNLKISLKSLLILSLLIAGSCAHATEKANYFRVWQGFKKSSLSEAKFMESLPQFMEDTVELYRDRALNNYIVVIPPKDKPNFIPDELALVGLSSRETYLRIRETPEGQAYSARHWDVFQRGLSHSSRHFVDYSEGRPDALIQNGSYDMFGKAIDWSSGYNLAFIGVRKSSISKSKFMARLQTHIEMARDIMGPKGLRGYIVIANENYEVAYLNWSSKSAHDKAGAQADAQSVFTDANEFMDQLMYEPTQNFKYGQQVKENSVYSTVSNSFKPNQKILMVVTSHGQLGDTGNPTGYYLSEVSHPTAVFHEQGFDVDFASPQGGQAPMDPASLDTSDAINEAFLANTELMTKLENTLELSNIDPTQYQAIVFAGGHGTMWDFPGNAEIQRISASIYESGGVVAAVCHGPAALVDIKLSNGAYLIAGKKVTGFTNAEEEAAQLTAVMPFALEDKLIERGAEFSGADLWQENVISSDRVITGQNPASAHKLAIEVAKALQ